MPNDDDNNNNLRSTERKRTAFRQNSKMYHSFLTIKEREKEYVCVISRQPIGALIYECVIISTETDAIFFSICRYT